jgi:hypothetical protein
MLPVPAPAVSEVEPPTMIWLPSVMPPVLLKFAVVPIFQAPPWIRPFSARKSMLPESVCAPTVSVSVVEVPPWVSR